MSLTAQLDLAFRASLTGTGDLGTPAAPVNLSAQLIFASGTGAGQIDKIFADNRSLAASAVEDLDLAGVLTDPLGATLTFAKVKGILIKAGAANPGDLSFGGDVNGLVGFMAAANDLIAVPPGGVELWMLPGTGKTVTAGTGDILQAAAAATAGTYTYDIVIIGTSV